MFDNNSIGVSIKDASLNMAARARIARASGSS